MSQEEGLSTGRFDSDRGDLSWDSVPKVVSAGRGFEPSAEVDPVGSTCDEPHTYQPDHRLGIWRVSWDLAGVERWVGRLA